MYEMTWLHVNLYLWKNNKYDGKIVSIPNTRFFFFLKWNFPFSRRMRFQRHSGIPKFFQMKCYANMRKSVENANDEHCLWMLQEKAGGSIGWSAFKRWYAIFNLVTIGFTGRAINVQTNQIPLYIAWSVRVFYLSMRFKHVPLAKRNNKKKNKDRR